MKPMNSKWRVPIGLLGMGISLFGGISTKASPWALIIHAPWLALALFIVMVISAGLVVSSMHDTTTEIE